MSDSDRMAVALSKRTSSRRTKRGALSEGCNVMDGRRESLYRMSLLAFNRCVVQRRRRGIARAASNDLQLGAPVGVTTHFARRLFAILVAAVLGLSPLAGA